MDGFEGKHLVLATIEDLVRAMSIRQLGAYSESLGIRTTLLFLVKKPGGYAAPISFSPSEVSRIAAFLKDEQATHLGFYLMTGSFKPYRALVAALRREGFEGMILAGGIHVSLCPEESLVEGAQFAVQGPGEIPLRAIFEGKDPASIPGLVWRDGGGKVRVNPVSPDQAIPMDDRPFPIWRLNRDRVLLNGRLKVLTEGIHRAYTGWHGTYYDLLTSIGCIYKCAYCCQVHKGKILRTSVDRAIREIKHARENLPFLEGVNVQDDSFVSGPKEWVDEFCRRMKAEVGLPFIVRMIPRQVTAELLEKMMDAGLVYVTMGLEGSDRLNKTLYKRSQTAEYFIPAAKEVLNHGLILSIDLLINNPYETEADLKEIAETLNSLPRPNWWVVSLSLTPFPKTPLYERAVQDGMIEKFPTDAYDAMLVPSREGAYRTPDFWYLLNAKLLPMINSNLGRQLIEAGPGSPTAAKTVFRLTKWLLRTRKITSFLRDNFPILYAVLYRGLRIFTGKKALPRIMRSGG